MSRLPSWGFTLAATMVATTVVGSGAPSARADVEVGIDPGWVVANGEVVDHVPELDALGVAWVRINFRLDAWNAPTAEWLAAYDRVVDSYIARGYRIYGLINDEAVASAAPHGSDAWIEDYVVNAVAIVDHFKDRIRVFEIINEPNDWAGGTSARFTPRAFAKILQETYLNVKHHAGHAGDRCWQVDLVSGALFSFDDTPSADYLAEAYRFGRTELAWDWTRAETGSFPLDGVGYHLYVAQGNDSSVGDVRSAMLANLDAVRDVVIANEGAMKPIFVSEMGFRADAVGPAGQAERLAKSFDTLAEHGDVALGLYFTMRDFPDNPWGVIDADGAHRPSFARLSEVANARRPALGAAVTDVELDAAGSALAPGELGEIVVTIENRGAASWLAGDTVRLAAAPGCPDAAAANELAWEPADGSGYANGIADARVFLPSDVPPDGTIELRIPVRAPDTAGTYTFAARMVDEGAAFFGATIRTPVVVEGAPVGDPAGDGNGDRVAAAGGCATGGTTGLALALLVLGLRRRSSHGLCRRSSH